MGMCVDETVDTHNQHAETDIHTQHEESTYTPHLPVSMVLMVHHMLYEYVIAPHNKSYQCACNTMTIHCV